MGISRRSFVTYCMAAGLSTAAAACLAGCGAGSDEKVAIGVATDAVSGDDSYTSVEEQKDVVLDESAWSYADGTIYWTAVMSNPNRTWGGTYPTFYLTAYDYDGNIMATQEQTLLEIWPQTRIAFSFNLDTEYVEPASVEITAGIGTGGTWKNLTGAVRPDYCVAGLSEGWMDIGVPYFSGTVNNPSDNAATICTTVLLRDENGTLIDGITGYSNNVPARGVAVLGIIGHYYTRNHVSAEALCTYWGPAQ